MQKISVKQQIVCFLITAIIVAGLGCAATAPLGSPLGIASQASTPSPFAASQPNSTASTVISQQVNRLSSALVVRGQSEGYENTQPGPTGYQPLNDQPAYNPPSTNQPAYFQPQVNQASYNQLQYNQPASNPANNSATSNTGVNNTFSAGPPLAAPAGLPSQRLPSLGLSDAGVPETLQGGLDLPDNFADLGVFVEDTRTGRFMFGVGVNSDAGLTGQIVIDERNFDFRAIPTSFDDFINGTAFRGAGQGFRIEALPGTRVQRYLFSFSEPYLGGTQLSLNMSGFFYDRIFFDWDEQRLGGRIALGYRLTHDLSLSFAGRAEAINIRNPRVRGVPELESILGDSDIYSGRLTLSHDTRDIPFAPTQGHLIELSYEQVFGSFDFPRADIDYRRYFLIYERPDTSGRHTISFNTRFGFSGSQTPIFENYYAGGFSTLRGFDFRGASPVAFPSGVALGGQFRFLGSVEYIMPLSPDDMIKAAFFCDFGTVEEDIAIRGENFRVAPGFGLRINIPALGQAPLALDLAFPVAHAPGDDIRNFSFFFGLGR